MTAYNSTQFDPPAPVASVTLINDVTEATLPAVLMQLDTGADVTLIPQEAARQLDLAVSETQYELMSSYWVSETAKSSCRAASCGISVTSAPVSSCIRTAGRVASVTSLIRVTEATGAGGSNCVEL